MASFLSGRMLSIILAILVGMVIIGVLFYPSQTKAQDSTQKLIDSAKNKQNTQKAAIPHLAVVHQDAVLRLRDLLSNKNLASCYADFGGLSAGSAQTAIEITYDKQNKKTTFVILGGSGRQEIFYKEYPGVTPCVVTDEGAEALFKKYYTQERLSNTLALPYKQVDSLFIRSLPQASSSGAQFELVVNRVDSYEMGSGWIYKPDANHLCILPAKIPDFFNQENFITKQNKFSLQTIPANECGLVQGSNGKKVLSRGCTDPDRILGSGVLKDWGTPLEVLHLKDTSFKRCYEKKTYDHIGVCLDEVSSTVHVGSVCQACAQGEKCTHATPNVALTTTTKTQPKDSCRLYIETSRGSSHLLAVRNGVTIPRLVGNVADLKSRASAGSAAFASLQLRQAVIDPTNYYTGEWAKVNSLLKEETYFGVEGGYALTCEKGVWKEASS